jgi:preprotein translocase SecE subunit
LADTPTNEDKQPRRIRREETLRERTEKAEAKAASSKPRRLRTTTRGIARPLKPVGRAAQRVGRLKPMRILGFIIVPPYFRNSWRELRQVTWPSGSESRRLTLAVMLFAIVFGALVAVVDFGLDKVFKQVLLK